ncbi:MAG TPA: LysR substrate-binding domain-containing protein, partial [Coriobacteriia bacterium]
AHLGMTGARLPHAKVDFEQMGSDDLLMISAPGSSLAGVKTVTLQQLAEQPFIVRETGSGTRLVFEKALKDRGVEPADLQVVMELGTSEAIVNAVEGGMGLGVVSHWMADKALALGTVAKVDAPGLPISRPFYAVLPRGARSRAADALLAHLRSEMEA